MMVSIVDE
uniref:Cytomegalovirus (HCMV) large phosphoprotein 150 (pp150) leader sequence n=1 Tax=Human cytomegalovirus TaxID=10359 RepID=Q69218_HCMV|nr:upstream ORF [Human betaherpesvirus 5]